MPLVFAENESSESGIVYDDRTGISYQYPTRYRRLVQTGKRFLYYRGRRTASGKRAPQVYFGVGIVGDIAPDPNVPNRLVCGVLDHQAFPTPVSFKSRNGEHFESGGSRRGYFQPGVRKISEEEFSRVLEAAQVAGPGKPMPKTSGAESKASLGPSYASQELLREVEEFALVAALREVRRRYPTALIQRQPRNNPGFDILVSPTDGEERSIHVEVKGTTRGLPQFFITEGELRHSARHARRFRLVVVYKIQLTTGTYEILWHEGAISLEAGFQISPVQWSCQLNRPAQP